MRLGRVGGFVFAVAVATALGASLRAEAAETDDGKVHLDKATTAFALARYDVAAEEFEKAFEAKPDPAVLYKAAEAHDLAGHKPRALALYQSYLRSYPKVANRAEVQARIEELKREGAPDKESSPEPRAPGAAAPPPVTGAQAVQIEAGEPPPGPTGPSGERPRGRTVLTVLFGVSLVGAGLGTAAAVMFGLLESKAESDYNTATTQAQQDSFAKTGKTYSALTNVSIAVTAVFGVGAVATGLTLLFMPRERKPAPVALTPIVGPGVAGGVATFRF